MFRSDRPDSITTRGSRFEMNEMAVYGGLRNSGRFAFEIALLWFVGVLDNHINCFESPLNYLNECSVFIRYC